MNISHWQLRNLTLSDAQRLEQLDWNNTFLKFIAWLNHEEGAGHYINGHFRQMHLFSRMDVFKQYWHVVDVNDMQQWNAIGSQIANVPTLNFTKRHTLHETNAASKLPTYFGVAELCQAMRYCFKDYLVFNLDIPRWTCSLIDAHGRNSEVQALKDFIKKEFARKPLLVPKCLS